MPSRIVAEKASRGKLLTRRFWLQPFLIEVPGNGVEYIGLENLSLSSQLPAPKRGEEIFDWMQTVGLQRKTRYCGGAWVV